MKNYYEILEVNRNASVEVIIKSYKALAIKYHPDRYEGQKRIYAQQKMKDINEAYNVLSDWFLKQQYDKELDSEIENIYNKDYRRNNFRIDKNNENDFGSRTKKVRKDKSNVGTFVGLIDLLKQIFRTRYYKKEKRPINRTDIIAGVLTLIVMVSLGLILWFIPFTNGLIRELLFIK